jgi:DNA-binding NarL/FixJ family response regulator
MDYSLLNDIRPTVYLVSPSMVQISQAESAASQCDCVTLAYDSLDGFLPYYDDTSPNCIVMYVVDSPDVAITAISKLLSRFPLAQVLLCVTNWQVSDIVRAVKSGVADVLAIESDIVRLSNALLTSLKKDRFNRSKIQLDIPQTMIEQLSSEEATIFSLMIQGRTTKQIGAELDLSVRTIHYRKKSIFMKLGVSDRNEAVEMVRRLRRSPENRRLPEVSNALQDMSA